MAIDPMCRIAQQVADCFSGDGYAFVEDDQVEALAVALASFLVDAGIPVNVPAGSGAQGMRTSMPGVCPSWPARWASAAWARG
jgi:hypothetical protein